MKKRTCSAVLFLFSLITLFSARSVRAADPEDAVPLTLDTNVSAVISSGGAEALFSFVPEETTYYIFYSSAGSDDTVGYLYDANMFELDENDDGENDGNFRIMHELDAGCQYYFKAMYYDPGKKGSFPVRLEAFRGLISAEPATDSEIFAVPESTPVLRVAAVSGGARLIYQWYNDKTGVIQGETFNTYTTQPVRGKGSYYCIVRDEFGNTETINFTVYPQNSLTAESVGDPDLYTSLNGTAVLKVSASCSVGSLTYQWHKYGTDSSGAWFDNAISGATAASYTVQNVNQYAQYYCRVKDSYNASADVQFTVRVDSGLSASRTGERLVETAPHGNVTLQVQASCTAGGITYEWHRKYMDPWSVVYDVIISSAVTDTCTVTDVTQSGDIYYCVVRDSYGSSVTLEYQVNLDNHLSVSAAGSTEILTAAGQRAVLKVNASCLTGNLSYTWYKGWYEDLSGSTSNTLQTETVTGPEQYHCEVRDEFGDSREIWFYVTPVSNVTPLAVDAAVTETLPVSGEYLFFRLAPGEAGEYRINCVPEENSRSYELRLYDADMQLVDSSGIKSGNLRYICHLEAGTEYIAAVRSLSYGYGSLDVSLSRSSGLRAFIREDLLTEETVYSLYEDDISMDVPYGETVTLGVLARCPEGAAGYQWYQEGYDREGRWFTEPVEGAGTEIFVTPAVTDMQYYLCEITDESGDCIRKTFSVAPARLLVRSGQDPYLLAGQGENVSLQADVWSSDDVTCEWFFISPEDESAARTRITGAENSSLSFVFTPEKAGTYCFRATDAAADQYRELLFEVAEKKTPVPLLPEQETAASVDRNGGSAVFSFVPEETGVYCFTSDQPTMPVSCFLYDEGWNRICSDTGMEQNYMVSSALEAGKTYYLAARYADRYTLGTFHVRISRLASEPDGISLELLTEELFTGETCSLVLESPADYVELWEDDGENIRLAASWDHVPGGEKLYAYTAETPGVLQYTARAYFAGNYAESGTVSVSVVQRPDVREDRILTLPASAAVIEEEAFAGTAMDEVILPEGCTSVRERAFASCPDLKLVYMPDSVTEIADDAFAGSSVIFLCESKNTAYEYAEAKGFAHVSR